MVSGASRANPMCTGTTTGPAASEHGNQSGALNPGPNTKAASYLDHNGKPDNRSSGNDAEAIGGCRILIGNLEGAVIREGITAVWHQCHGVNSHFNPAETPGAVEAPS